MPRPKRTKIVSEHAKAQAAAVQPTVLTKPAKAPAGRRTAARQKPSPPGNNTATTRASSSQRAAAPFVQQDGIEISMSGGLGLGDVNSAQRTLEAQRRASRSSSRSIERVRRSSRPRPALAEISPLRVSNEPAGSAPSKKPVATTRKSPWQVDSKALVPLDDGFEEYLRSSSPHLPTTIISRPVSVSRVQGTPSCLSIANFKRRPRQPSILRMVQQKAPTNAEDDNSDQDDALGSFDNSPDLVSQTQSPISRKRKAASLHEDGLLYSSPRRSKHTNRSSPGSINRSVPSAIEGTAEDEAATISDTNSPDLPILERHDRPAFKKTPPPRRHGRRVRSKHPAPKNIPLSSPPTSASSPHSTPSSGTHDPRNKPWQRDKSKKDIPARPSRRIKAAQAASRQSLSTAALQSLLPRRRTRGQLLRQQDTLGVRSSPSSLDDESVANGTRSSDTDAPTSELIEVQEPAAEEEDDHDEEEDELSRPRRQRQQRSARRSPRSKPRRIAAGNESRAGIEAARTYSRRKQSMTDSSESAGVHIDSGITLSDGEDNEEADSRKRTAASKTAAVKQKSNELAEAAKKFAAVDDWELSFESCDVGGGSSSPWR